MMPPATAQEIEQVLGDIDGFTIERILDTHATVDEIVEALGEVEDEARFGDRHEPTSLRVLEVREILEELTDDNDDEAYVS